MEPRYSKAYPNTVLKLFIKLYCKRRDAPKNKLMEAIKSWVSLNHEEKDTFVKKYAICHINHKKNKAKYLSKTQPYFKKRNPKSLCEEFGNKPDITSDINKNDANDLEVENENNNHDELKENDIGTNISDNMEVSHSLNHTPPLELSESIDFCNPIDTHTKVLAEPSPPSIRCAKELFDMIHSDNVLESMTWTSLSKTQKSRYQKAVVVLKNNYITKFKAYLESLPSKELFRYYNNYSD